MSRDIRSIPVFETVRIKNVILSPFTAFRVNSGEACPEPFNFVQDKLRGRSLATESKGISVLEVLHYNMLRLSEAKPAIGSPPTIFSSSERAT